MLRIILPILILQLLCFKSIAQSGFEFGQNPVQNFTRLNYKAGNQNWSIAQSSNGIMYFGNNNGLLSYNGQTWNLYTLPNHTIVRSVAVDSRERIFVGSFEEFGYFKSDEYGKMHYTSLSGLLKNYAFHNDEIWKIIVQNEDVYFQSFTVIFKFSKGKIETIIPGGFISSFNLIDKRIIVTLAGKGLFELKNNQFSLISSVPFFKNTEISTILSYDKENWLIATSRDGIYLFDRNNKIENWITDIDNSLKYDQINRGQLTENGKVIVGTILNGVYILSHEGKLIQHIHKGNGLQNNTVLSLFTDISGNIWIGLDWGIDFLLLNSDVSFYFDNKGKLGSVYAIDLFTNKLFVGTNQGLYYTTLDSVKSSPVIPEFKLVANSQGQVWNITHYEKQLICGHNTGTFEIENDYITQLSNISGGLSYEKYAHNGKEYLLGSTYTSIVVYEKINGKWKYRNEIDNFMHPVKQIKVDYLGNIWASHFTKGLYRIKLNDSLTRSEKIDYYGKSKGFISDYQINVSRLQNRLVFINRGKLFIYNDLLDSILPYNDLENQLGIKPGIRNIYSGFGGHSWLIADQGIIDIVNNSNVWKINKFFPVDLFYNKVVSGQEFILPLTESSAILSLNNGFALLKSGHIKKPSSAVKPILTNVIVAGESEIELPVIQNDGVYPELDFGKNSLLFKYAFPIYHSSSYFYVKLEDIDENWVKTNSAEFKYDRIPPGKYTFMLKAVDENGRLSETIKWYFRVLPPWYSTGYMKILYFLLIVSVILFLRYYYKKRLQYQTRRIKAEKERELIKVRNEKLEAEIKHKTRELANTTLSIIKKNELLLEIRKLLMLQKKQNTTGQIPKFYSIINLLDKNISNDEDWRIFESNFEQAHEEFLKRIKEKIPDLTPSDLKLCAYLRMNLSSKKIALLLGITIRGVENHRYRLRKKIGLEHDSNLIDFMMKF